jgi:hypothetical protein
MVQEELELQRLRQYVKLQNKLRNVRSESKRAATEQELERLQNTHPVILTEYVCGQTSGSIPLQYNCEQPLKRFLGSSAVAQIEVASAPPLEHALKVKAAMQDAYIELLSATTVPVWYERAITQPGNGTYELKWLERFDVGHRTERYICHVHGWRVYVAMSKGIEAMNDLQLPKINYDSEYTAIGRNTLLVMLMYEARHILNPKSNNVSDDTDVPPITDEMINRVERIIA